MNQIEKRERDRSYYIEKMQAKQDALKARKENKDGEKKVEPEPEKGKEDPAPRKRKGGTIVQKAKKALRGKGGK